MSSPPTPARPYEDNLKSILHRRRARQGGLVSPSTGKPVVIVHLGDSSGSEEEEEAEPRGEEVKEPTPRSTHAAEAPPSETPAQGDDAVLLRPPGSPSYLTVGFSPLVLATGEDLPALRVNTVVEPTVKSLQGVLRTLLTPTTVFVMQASGGMAWVPRSLKLLPDLAVFQVAARRLHHPAPLSPGDAPPAFTAADVDNFAVADVMSVHCSTCAAHRALPHQVAITVGSRPAPLHIRFGDKLTRTRWVTGLAVLHDMFPSRQ